MNLQQLAGAVPPEISRTLRDTWVESVFNAARRRSQNIVEVAVPTPTGEFIHSVYDDWRSLPAVRQGTVYERATYESLQETVDKYEDPVLFDVGAHWGITIRYALELGISQNRIVGFEASSHNFSLLERNLGDTEVDLRNGFVGSGSDSIRLDNERMIPDIVKIDVEGAEWGVLQSMENIERMPALLLEVHPHLLGCGPGPDNVTDASVIEFLHREGYELTFFEQSDLGDRQVQPPLPSREPYFVKATP